MTSRFDVTKKKRSFVWWQIPLFSGLLIIFLLILYPPELFINSLLNNSVPSEVSVSYLKNMIAKDPDNTSLKIVLAEQEIQLGNIKDARVIIEPYVTKTPQKDFQWKILWLYYQIVRIETFALKENDQQRIDQAITLQSLLPSLMKSPFLTGDQAATLAEDSLAFNLTERAAAFYKLAINTKRVKKSAQFYAQAAKAMLYVKDYQSSADFYLLAMQESIDLKQKRQYYTNAVDSLVSGGVAAKAFTFAEQHIDGLKADSDTLIYLTRLAIKANQQVAADHYITRVLQLQIRDSTP